MTASVPPSRRGSSRPLTGGQRGCLAGCLIVALLGAAGMVALGWWAREALRRNPSGAAGLLLPGEPESPVRAEPGGLARRLDLDVFIASSVAWSGDGRAFALCGMPGMSLRKLMPQQRPGQPWDIPKAQEEQQRRVREAMTARAFVVNSITGASRVLPQPERDAEVEEVAWWSDGRLLVVTQRAYSPTEDQPRDGYGLRRLWLVNPSDGHAEKVGEVEGVPHLTPGRAGVAISTSLKGGQRETYVLLPGPSGPALTKLPAAVRSQLTWDALGNLYSWGSGAKGERWAVARVFLPGGPVAASPVREIPGRSTVPLVPDEILTAQFFPAGSKTRAFYALNPGLGVARRLSEALPDTADYPRTRFLGGRWILVAQERYRDSQRVHRLYGYSLAQGRFYPVTNWGPLETLVERGAASPGGNLLLLQKTVRPENFFRIFTSGLSSEAWQLRLDERELLAQDPTNAEEWKVKPGEECPAGGG